MIYSRVFAMPNSETFSIKPIGDFVKKYVDCSKHSIDPFARNCALASVTNDLDPKTNAQFHMEAEAFCIDRANWFDQFDLAIFDPPYSPRQISECYKSVGLSVGMKETQNAALYRRVRDALDSVMLPSGIVLSFGWNSNGMGKGRNYKILEILMVAHGGGHNDTICMAEQKL